MRRVGIAALIVLAALGGVLAFVSRPPGAEPREPGPPPAARAPEPGSLLERVLAAHGGVARWQRLEKLRVKLRFGGAAFKLRLAEPEPLERWVELDLREPQSIWSDYPKPGQRGVFGAERVSIETADGRELRALEHPREVLLGSRRRQLWWDELDLLYFAGYASWNYFQGPFLLLRDGVEAREIESWDEGDVRWRRLAVRFHGEIPTHSREQVFYYDESFRQRRHDYAPRSFAGWADAAHYSSRYRQFEGLWLPTRRRVVPRRDDNTTASAPTLVWIEVLEVEPVAAR